MKKAGISIAAAAFILSGCQHLSAGSILDKQTETQPVKQPDQEAVKKEKQPALQKKPQTESRVPSEAAKKPLYSVSPVNWTLKPLSSSIPKKTALITIDDAPDKHALEMAKTLKTLGVNAIFFVNGHFLENKEGIDALKEIHKMGFQIGNHTYHHKELKGLSEEEQKKEILDLNTKIKEIIGEKPKFFRAPFGINTDFSRKLAAQEKMTLMNWTFGYDWNKEYENKEALVDIMKNTPYLTDGSIILMHDRKWTSSALKEIVGNLRKAGYQLADPNNIQSS
ncbi:polysaccharide deacetylase family protein [Metabacillus sp. GX 13764]|uniref:polysaccharide deacetylase family protein n=1 Tax=Metabacillus kandeliae TaxID=2900151 RepID=UPI001E5525A4|nr:polysaccharide deacetylase family protein [Metabacillus kandeliae]MCD7033960.1 polysaccharide deacetylase family protein [Metabacillus kandeliae]